MALFFGGELDAVLETLQRAFPPLCAATRRSYVSQLCEVVPGFLEAFSDAAAAAAVGRSAPAERCLAILQDAAGGPKLQNGDSGEEAAASLLEAVAEQLPTSPRLPRDVVLLETRVERTKPGHRVKKSLDCRLAVRLRVQGSEEPRVVLVALEAKRTQTTSASSLRAFLNHDVAVRSEPGHHAVLTAFVSWLCEIPKLADYEGADRLLFGAASERVHAVVAVLRHETEALIRRVVAAEDDGAAASEQLQARRAGYLRERLEAIVAQKKALLEEEAVVRALLSPGDAAAVDRGHLIGSEKRKASAAAL